MTAEPSYPVSATAYGQRVATYFGFAPATPAAKVGDTSRARYEAKIQSGLRNNLLVTLQLIIERDPEIPSPCVWCATPTTKIVGAVPGVSAGNPECGC